jgi:two-component system, OmpR family, heavy metal sensor histidine kinase CusS
MKSIRLSLIIYFLVLLTGALGAVSWFSYRTTAMSLRERQRDAQKMIETQYAVSSKSARADLDRRILLQAQTMLTMSHSTTIHAEGLFYPLGMLGSASLPNGYLPMAMYCYQGTHEKLAPDIFRLQPLNTHIESGDKLVANAEGGGTQEYFQTYRSNGYPMDRSESMGDNSFTLDEEVRKHAALLKEYYDDVELQPGVKVRRVTLKASVPEWALLTIPWPWKGMPPPSIGPVWWQSRPKGAKGPKGPAPPSRPPGFVSKAPNIFIQYASDRGPTEAKILALQKKRAEEISQLETTIGQNLQQLGDHMLWIALATLGAVWLGGYVVIRLGLAPLAKMSEAVSQVSPTNFHLPLEPETLPNELRPIADRLVEVLEQLQKAFAREKQASADISHELRTPLAALMTNLELGLRKTRTAQEYRDILEECRSSGQHMYQLVERLLTLARLDAGADHYRPAEADVTEIALQCADLIRPLARARGLTLRLNMPDAITMETDPNKLREVIVNLLHNAVEYNRPDGAIDLAVERVNGHVRLEVRDTGIGIKPNELEHLFERFYRADPSRQADTPHAGLGLAIVKSYVDLMGGTIRVASSEAGTAFTVELPFVAAAPDLKTAVQAEAVLVAR